MTERIAAMLSENANRGPKQMSAAALARSNATKLVARVEVRTRSRMLAYEHIARGVGRSTTWVRALISNGVSRVDGDVGRKIDSLLIREIEAEITRATHDLETTRRTGAHPLSPEMAEAEALLAKAQRLLNEYRGVSS